MAEIMEDFDAASERELRTKIGGMDNIPIAEFYKYYVELFRPDTAFSITCWWDLRWGYPSGLRSQT